MNHGEIKKDRKEREEMGRGVWRKRGGARTVCLWREGSKGIRSDRWLCCQTLSNGGWPYGPLQSGREGEARRGDWR